MKNVKDYGQHLKESHKLLIIESEAWTKEETFDALETAWNGNVNALKSFLTRGMPVNLGEGKKTTLLHAAAYYDRAAYMKVLIDAGANLNMLDSYGQTALFLACERRSFSCIDLLIKKGADVNIKDPDGRSPIMMAREYCKPITVKKLILAGANLLDAFETAGDFYDFFKGKTGWLPDASPIKSVLNRMSRSEDLFGE